MARSNTAPTSYKPQRNGSRNKQPSRSATAPQKPPPTKSYQPRMPYPYFPFHSNHDATPPSSTRQASLSSFRPQGLDRQNSVQTRYMTMLLNLDSIPRLHNILASFFTWILLAGFLIFPGTFTTFQDNLSKDDSKTASAIVKTIKHIQLLVLASVCSGIGAAGMMWLWWRWRQNYVWLLNRIFFPGCLNSLAGLISTLVGVYGQQKGVWNVTARITAAVTGGIMVVTGVLFAFYNFAVLSRVKKKHHREMEQGHASETIVEKLNRPALEPGSVV